MFCIKTPAIYFQKTTPSRITTVRHPTTRPSCSLAAASKTHPGWFPSDVGQKQRATQASATQLFVLASMLGRHPRMPQQAQARPLRHVAVRSFEHARQPANENLFRPTSFTSFAGHLFSGKSTLDLLSTCSQALGPSFCQGRLPAPRNHQRNHTHR